MISIKISNQYVDIDADITIAFELNNDLFNIDETLPRQFTYQVNLPATPKNNKIFGWLNHVNSSTEWSERYDAEIIYPGMNILGKCKVDKVTKKGYDVAFFIGKSAFKEAGDKLMTTLVLGGQRKIVDPYTNQDDVMSKLLDIANTPEEYDYLFAPIIHGDFYNGTLDDSYTFWSSIYDFVTYSGISNYFKDSEFKKNWQDSGTSPLPTVHNDTNFIPFFKLKYIISQIFEENGYQLKDDFFITDERLMIYVYNNFALDWDYPGSSPMLIQCNNDILPQNHMPQNTISDFLNGFCKMFNIHQSYSFIGQKVRLIAREDIYNNLEEEDWTYKQNGDLEQAAPDKNQYGFKATLDASDLVHSNIFEPAKTLEKDLFTNRQIIETSLSWPYSARHVDPLDGARKMLISQVGQQGSSDFLPDVGAVHPFEPKLMIYRGMRPDNNADDYPYLTPANITEAGGIEGDINIDWKDESHGLVANFYKNWLVFISNTKQVSMPLHLTIADVVNLDLTKKKRINSATYFIKKISFNLTHSGIENAKADLYKI